MREMGEYQWYIEPILIISRFTRQLLELHYPADSLVIPELLILQGFVCHG